MVYLILLVLPTILSLPLIISTVIAIKNIIKSGKNKKDLIIL